MKVTNRSLKVFIALVVSIAPVFLFSDAAWADGPIKINETGKCYSPALDPGGGVGETPCDPDEGSNLHVGQGDVRRDGANCKVYDPAFPVTYYVPCSIIPASTGGTGAPIEQPKPDGIALQHLSNGLAWYALSASVVGILVSASLWALGSKGQNPGQELTGKRGLVVCCTAAFFVGIAPTLVNYLNQAAEHMDNKDPVAPQAAATVDPLTGSIKPMASTKTIPPANPGTGGTGGSSGGTGGAAPWGGHENGKIPSSALCALNAAPGLQLECGAAAAYNDMDAAFAARFGHPIGITDGYRSYEEQVQCRAEKGNLCADPGTSNHGWGKAVDIGGYGVNTGAGEAYDWLKANAGNYGWVHPAWAEPGGSKPEPWHWEYGSIS